MNRWDRSSLPIIGGKSPLSLRERAGVRENRAVFSYFHTSAFGVLAGALSPLTRCRALALHLWLILDAIRNTHHVQPTASTDPPPIDPAPPHAPSPPAV